MGAAFKFVDWNPLVISAAEKMFAFFCLGIARGSFKMRFSRPVLLGAICSYACTTCFVAANKLTTAANAIVLQYTNPMFVVLLSWLVLRREGATQRYLAHGRAYGRNRAFLPGRAVARTSGGQFACTVQRDIDGGQYTVCPILWRRCDRIWYGLVFALCWHWGRGGHNRAARLSRRYLW